MTKPIATSSIIVGIAGVAKYTGLSVATVKYHLYVARDLVPSYAGRTLIFDREELDKFYALRRKQGRPAKGSRNV